MDMVTVLLYSAHSLPKVYQALLTVEESRINDFYPTDFDMDTDGKRFMWQTAVVVAHIPRLLEGVKLPEKTISEADLMEAVLWHEYEGNKPPNRLMHGRGFFHNSAPSMSSKSIDAGYCRGFTSDSFAEATFKVAGNGWGMGRAKVNNSFNRREHVECSPAPSWTSKSTCEDYGRRFTSDASSEVIYKDAGNGWGAERGQVNTGLNGREHIESTRWGITYKDTGNGWGAGRGQVNTSLNSREHIESTRWGIPHKDAGNGWGDSKVSSLVGSSINIKQQARPYGRAQPMNNSFGLVEMVLPMAQTIRRDRAQNMGLILLIVYAQQYSMTMRVSLHELNRHFCII
ncbi:5'-3' exoribonuclease 2 [Morella rubra]|uniref:5'-3' exoribonuclease 2 n=1 Tax=Morella rubra TaxID=262757 RepID=A0A6A1WNL1_9ROSI|nr:5'-3' exoribonuclease 2 [Morella rubra]